MPHFHDADGREIETGDAIRMDGGRFGRTAAFWTMLLAALVLVWIAFGR